MQTCRFRQDFNWEMIGSGFVRTKQPAVLAYAGWFSVSGFYQDLFCVSTINDLSASLMIFSLGSDVLYFHANPWGIKIYPILYC